MSGQVGTGTGSSELTVDQAAQAFLSNGLLSDEDTEQTRETPPAQESPEPAPEETEASTEPVEVEGTPAEEQTETPEQEPSSAAIDPATKVKVKVDGQEIEATLDEVIKGYSRTADYTRKTQELAAQRKTQEAEFAALRDERAQYATYLVQLEQTLKDQTPKEPDWNKLQQELTPAEFGASWAQWQAHEKQMTALADERAAAVAKVNADQAAQYQTRLADEKAKLFEAIPEWKDAELGKAERARLITYAEKSGFKAEEIGNMNDHRAFVALRKAMLWDEAQAKRPAIVQRIQKVTTAPPGPGQKTTTPQTKVRQLQERLAKTGSLHDAAAAFLALDI
jgi:hypothetical protein